MAGGVFEGFNVVAVIATGVAFLGCALICAYSRRIHDPIELRKWSLTISLIMLCAAVVWGIMFVVLLATSRLSPWFSFAMGGFILLASYITRYALKEVAKEAKAGTGKVTERMRFMFNLGAVAAFVGVMGVLAPALR